MPCLKANFIDYEVTLNELYIIVKNEIIEIAKRNNPDFTIVNYISKYGRKNLRFSSLNLFSNSQLGKPNALGNAMLKWLKERKYDIANA